LKCSHTIASFVDLIVTRISKQFDNKCDRAILSSRAQRF